MSWQVYFAIWTVLGAAVYLSLRVFTWVTE